jgi:hypothetical protein
VASDTRATPIADFTAAYISSSPAEGLERIEERCRREKRGTDLGAVRMILETTERRLIELGVAHVPCRGSDQRDAM